MSYKDCIPSESDYDKMLELVRYSCENAPCNPSSGPMPQFSVTFGKDVRLPDRVFWELILMGWEPEENTWTWLGDRGDPRLKESAKKMLEGINKKK